MNTMQGMETAPVNPEHTSTELTPEEEQEAMQAIQAAYFPQDERDPLHPGDATVSLLDEDGGREL